MDSLFDFLDRMTATIIFCLAMFVLLIGYRETSMLIGTTKSNISKQNTIYEQRLDEVKVDKVTYAELTTYLLGSLEYNTKVNQLEIDKDTYDYQKFDFSLITQGEYQKSYEYDTSGKIVKVLFTN